MRNVDLKNQSLEVLVINYQTTKDNASFGELYNRYYNNLFAYCKKITGEREDAYDITTNTFIKASEKISQLSSPELFPSWLFRIAHNMCMDNGKAVQKNRCVAIDDQFNVADTSTDIEILMEKEAMLNQLEMLMDNLDLNEKEILVEKYLNKKSIAELQKIYNISASAIKMRLARARNKVAEMAMN
ncbi:MAG: RNA polymerase sigma factor [Saprospiraceae bacterium]